VAEGKRWFDSLADGGSIEMAWQETFWAHGFGKVIDRFGVPWMVNVVKQGNFPLRAGSPALSSAGINSSSSGHHHLTEM
jgi:hypothetical protein